MFHLKKLRKLYAVITILILLTFYSCHLSEVQLHGRWSNGEDQTIEFLYNNTFISKGMFGITTSGTYRVIDSTRISLEYKGILGITGPQIYSYSIRDNTLTLNNDLIVNTFYKD